MSAEDSPQISYKNAPESRYRRLSRITMVVMLYGAGAALLLLIPWIFYGVFGWPDFFRFLIYPFSGCLLAFFLGVVAHVLLICFGAMRITLRSMLVSALLLGLGATGVISGAPWIYVGLVMLAGLATFWLYHFLKASYEQDRRDGIV